METENSTAKLSQWEKETLGHYGMQAGLSDKSAARLTSRAPHDSASVGCHGNDCRLCVGTAELAWLGRLSDTPRSASSR